MIRFAICDAGTGTILRSGVCSDPMFNRQALGGNEVAVQIDAADWPVNDATHYIDLSGPAPVLTPKPE